MKKNNIIGIFFAVCALCMIFAFPARADAAGFSAKNMYVDYQSPDKKSVSIKLPYVTGRQYEVALCNYKKKQVKSETCSFYVTFDGLKTNQVYYYRARMLNYNSDLGKLVPASGWTDYKMFSTIKYKVSLVGRSRKVAFKVPKVPGVKYVKVSISTKKNKGYKTSKKVKPKKKVIFTKCKKKKFVYYKDYYSTFPA